MADYKDTGLWKRTFASRHEDPHTNAREKLRQAYENMRERAKVLVGEISRILPEYTVHDISHLDALWEVADLIVGPTYSLTPTEAFVLGGAILTHDAGMSLAAYPHGLDDLKQHRTWGDTVAYYTNEIAGELRDAPGGVELSPEILQSVIPDMLRRLHAEQAENLTSLEWGDSGGRRYKLLEDEDLCQLFGRPIGQVAHSHWWSIEEVEQKLATRTIGAPTFCPADWIIDLLKVACILRVADVAHLDSRRAPGFLRALRHPTFRSKIHWIFQERLTKPTCRGDALHYTAGEPFQSLEAESWWLCFEALGMVYSELRHCDALLADKRSELVRFTARRVANVEDPDRLVQDIPVEGWRPVDTRIHIGDVPGLISKLGGEELYGHNPIVALRELIQNAADAVRARRRLEQRSHNWGQVTVRLVKKGDDYWLHVEDNGIGMSEQVIRRYLLNFGASYWGSELMRSEFPGLLAQGLKQTGRYGIGFFSLSIISDDVRILTRRFNFGYDRTYSLDFASGLWSRPILRVVPSAGSELRDGGTRVSVKLNITPTDRGGLLFKYSNAGPDQLGTVCGYVAPALDVDLFIVDVNGNETRYGANDWLEMAGCQLWKKAHWRYDYWGEDDEKIGAACQRFEANIRPVANGEEVVGRVFIVPDPREAHQGYGCVTVGGLAAGRLRGICGILRGFAVRAARDFAIPTAENAAVAKWASEQAQLLLGQGLCSEEQAQAACTVYRLAGTIGTLKFALCNEGWLNSNELSHWCAKRSRILVLQSHAYSLLSRFRPSMQLNDAVLCMLTQNVGIIDPIGLQMSDWVDWPENHQGPMNRRYSRSLIGLLLETAADAWKIAVRDLEAQLLQQERSFTSGLRDLRPAEVVARDGAFEANEKVYVLERTEPPPQKS